MTSKDDTAARIATYAASLFERRGISAVTMDDIAVGLGISKKTLYQHFDSKETLARAALDLTFHEIGQELSAARKDAAGDFSAWLRGHVWVVAGRYGRLQTSLLIDLSRNQPGLYDHYLALSQQTIERHFAALVREGVRVGELRRDLDLRVIISALITLSQHISRPETLANLRMSPREAFESIIDLLLDGLRTRPAPRTTRRRRASATR